MFKLLIFLAAAIFVQNIYADDLTSALQQTQDCLRNQNCAAASTDAGKEADRKLLEAVAGNAGDKQALYNLSADVMAVLFQQSGGDPAKMQALLQNAQTDPERFLNSLTPEMKAKIGNIASEIEKKQASGQKQ
ncbi:MAG: hypothetical protein ACXWF8_08530 [Methylobacter sp.]